MALAYIALAFVYALAGLLIFVFIQFGYYRLKDRLRARKFRKENPQFFTIIDEAVPLKKGDWQYDKYFDKIGEFRRDFDN